MPRPRKYKNDAERSAAYRQRKRDEKEAKLWWPGPAARLASARVAVRELLYKIAQCKEDSDPIDFLDFDLPQLQEISDKQYRLIELIESELELLLFDIRRDQNSTR